MVWELTTLVFAEYRGIGGFAKLLIAVAVLCALAVCTATVSQELGAAPVLQLGYRVALMAGRWVTTVLAGIVLTLSIFFGIWGLPGRPNVERYRWIATAWFVGDAGLWFWAEVDSGVGVGMLRVGLSASCLLAWALLITRAGEISATPSPLERCRR